MPEVKAETIKDLSFADLVALRSFYKSALADIVDKQGVPKIDDFSIEMGRIATENIDRISKFIHNKFERVKKNSTPAKT